MSTKRIKHIVRNPYHLWAHQTQDWAANSSRNMSFRGTDAKSYGTVIGTIVEVPKVGSVYLVSSEKYSSTTAGHLSDLWGSIPHDARESGRVFEVPYLSNYGSGWARSPRGGDMHAANVLHLLGEYFDNKGKAERARLWPKYKAEAAMTAYRNAKAYAKMFKVKGIKWPKAEEVVAFEARIPEFEAKAEASAAASAERWRKQREAWEAGEPERRRQREEAEEVRRMQEAERRAKAEEAKAAWLVGGPFHESLRYLFNPLMRLNGDTVETTMGASVPAQDVARLAPMVLRLIDAGQDWRPGETSYRLGSFTLNGVSAVPGVVTVGCHRFTFEEVRRFAAIIAGYRTPATA